MTSKKLGSLYFQRIANSVLDKGESALRPLFDILLIKYSKIV